jgi:DNA-binding SARP family transcriptional activator
VRASAESEQAQGSAAAVRYAVLGPIELRRDGRLLPAGGPRQIALLAYLLLHPNRAVSGDHLIEALWGEQDPAGAVKRLQVAIARLRRTLSVARPEPALRTVAGGYLLEVAPGESDADAFHARLGEGRRALHAGAAGRAVELLGEGLALWRGPAYADVSYEPFARTEIRRLEELRLAAQELRCEAGLQIGRHADLVPELEALVLANPTRERLAAQLMLALYRTGRQVDALEAYGQVRARLSTELGLEPGPELQGLQRAILEQAPSLALAGAASDVASTGAASPPATPPALPAVLVASAREPFAGRDAGLQRLRDVYTEAAGGERRLLLLSGEPGLGKTRLAAQFALRAHHEGAVVLYGRCDEEALLAQQPFAEALRHYVCACPPDELGARLARSAGELRRIVPELAERFAHLPEPLTTDPEGARLRLFEAVAALLADVAQGATLVLVLDDLHWADRATLSLLKYLARDARPAPLMILGTFRETELDDEHPLSALLAELGRERLVERHALAALDAAAVEQLVAAYVGERASPELRRAVVEETEGNAFFVVELLRHLGEAQADDAGGETGHASARLAIPDGVRDVVRQRVARLGQQTARMLAAAAVLGARFDLDLLKRLGDLDDDDLADRLEAAVRARVLEEVTGSPGRHAFAHALIRATLYDGLTATRRALLHRRAAAALEDVHRDDLEPYLAEVAHHFTQAAGPGDRSKAITYAARAGRHALAQLDYEQAAAQFRHAVALIDDGDPDPHRPPQERCDLVIAQGEAERQAGDPAYRRTLLDGAELAQRLGDPRRLAHAALANSRAIYSSALGVDRKRVAALNAALDMLPDGDSPTRAQLLALLALEFVAGEDWRRRDELGDEALAMARRVGEPRTLALVLTQRVAAQWSPQTLAGLRPGLREAFTLAELLQDPVLAGQAAYFGSHLAMEAGDLVEADRALARLAAVADELGQPLMRWYAAIVRTKRCTISGDPAAAERLAFEALELGRSAGQPDTMLWFLGQLFVTRFLRGALDAGEPHLPSLLGSPDLAPPPGDEITPSRSMPLLVAATISVVLCDAGRPDEARAYFDTLMGSGLEDLPRDYTLLAIPALASVACARLGDTAAAARLDAILEPHAQRFVNTGTSWFGATTHHLALLAAVRGEREEAHARFAAAERAYRRLGATPWLARVRRDRQAALGPRTTRPSSEW